MTDREDGAGRWLTLVPVQVFGLACEDHEAPRPVSWGLMDAVEAWSDCNRADGHIYRVEDVPGPRRPGESARVWVAEEDLGFFETAWGDGYSTDDMAPPTEVLAGPPLPPEPPDGAVVFIDGRAVQRIDAQGTAEDGRWFRAGVACGYHWHEVCPAARAYPDLLLGDTLGGTSAR